MTGVRATNSVNPAAGLHRLAEEKLGAVARLEVRARRTATKRWQGGLPPTTVGREPAAAHAGRRLAAPEPGRLRVPFGMIPLIDEILGPSGWSAWAGIALAVFAGAVFQVAIGVGFGSIAGPSAMLMAPFMMPATIGCLSMLAAMLGATRIAGSIAYRELAYALVGRAAGATAAGVLLAKLGSPDGFALLFAGLTLLGVGTSYARLALPLNPLTLMLAGALSGLMATVTTIGGPPMALVYQNEAMAKARPTLNAFFALGMIPSLAALWGAGVLGIADAIRAALLLPAVVGGIYAARWLAPLIDRRYRAILLAFCVAAAAVIAVRALLRLAG